ncbi:hypothetical protein G9A89_010690 [Geosiphon pyriformis]|nr:hypothetical protein G9A89_010690 [Geosiphon pyriformis]
MFMLRFGDKDLRYLGDEENGKGQSFKSSDDEEEEEQEQEDVRNSSEKDPKEDFSNTINENIDEEKTEIDWRKLYKKLAGNLISYVAKERRITWLGNHGYWGIENDKESKFGKIARLNHVWWFDVRSSIKSVPAGSYHVIWRIKADRRAILQ